MSQEVISEFIDPAECLKEGVSQEQKEHLYEVIAASLQSETDQIWQDRKIQNLNELNYKPLVDKIVQLRNFGVCDEILEPALTVALSRESDPKNHFLLKIPQLRKWHAKDIAKPMVQKVMLLADQIQPNSEYIAAN